MISLNSLYVFALKILREYPDDLRSLNNKAAILNETKDHVEALGLLDSALLIFHDLFDAKVMVVISWLHGMTKAFDVLHKATTGSYTFTSWQRCPVRTSERCPMAIPGMCLTYLEISKKKKACSRLETNVFYG
jgi:hypothetical protein